jgi:hypothetical protein
VVNAVGDEAIETAARDKFGVMLKKITVAKTRIGDDFEVDEGIIATTKAQQANSRQVVQAQQDIVAEVKAAIAEAKKAGRQVTKAKAQAIVDKYKIKFAQLDSDEADEMIEQALFSGFGTEARSIKVAGGVVGFFLLHVAVPSRGR